MTVKNTGHSAPESNKPRIKVLLCSPRGFCAGVVRAIDSVEQALKRYGVP
jgi:4-hydroxy-3-methylbut-2-enyl diphosphate reductase